MKIFQSFRKNNGDEKTVHQAQSNNNLRSVIKEELPPIEDGKKLPETTGDFKEWHCKLLHRLDKHAEKESFSGLITLQVDIPKFIRLAQELDLIDWAYYEEALSYLKNDNLKSILRENNLKVSGKKQELVDRILQNVNELDVKNSKFYSDFYVLTEKGHKISDNYYIRFETERIEFFKTAIELIQAQKLNDAYRMICKRNAEMPVPPGMGCDWKQWYYNGLSIADRQRYSYQLDYCLDKLMMSATIYNLMSGESFQKIQFYIRHAFNVETNIVSDETQ